MYVVTPYPNYLYAFDLKQPGAPPKWTYKPATVPAAQGVACCDVVNRGAAYSNGRIFYNTLDAQTVAVDATTGKEIWKTRVGDINRGETITMAPLVVKGKVLVGNSGGEMGVRGWLTALDAKTGKLAWRAFATGPDKDVLIGPRFKPFYPADRKENLGVTTWPGDAWKIGGGGVWGWISYDPELDLIYYGTPGRGILTCVRVTTSGRPPCLLGTPIRAKQCGLTSGVLTISSTTMASTSSYCSICRSKV
jgi:lanthanide-dependent methanol dehydrogenase